MRNIKSKDTKIELILRKKLWQKGYRYRKNYDLLPGKPDIALTKYKITVFCDGEFFHGKDWEDLKLVLLKSNNNNYWIKKIYGNIIRDEEVNKKLQSIGWRVVRFWADDIKKNPDNCVTIIERLIMEETRK